MPFTTAGYPGEVSKVEWAQLLAFFTLHGAKDLTVTPVGGQDRTVQVTFSQAFAGVFVTQTSPDTVQLPANGSSFSRRDRIILRHDWNANETTLTSKQGTPSSSPSLPSLTLNPGVLYEQHLCQVRVGPGQGELDSEDIGLVSFMPAPVVRMGDESAIPFASFGALVLDEATGLARFSDGSSYQFVRTRMQDLDRRILRRNGTGAGTISTSGVGFYSINNATTLDVKEDGESWGAGLHSAQFRPAASGQYRVGCRSRITRTNVDQTGRVNLQLRSGMTAGTANSGSVIETSSMPFPVASPLPVSIPPIDDIRFLSSGSIYGWTIENFSSHTVDRDDDGIGCHFAVEYVGP